MAPIPGTRLGSYEIIAPLGAGGMGEVYQARDVRLNRTVALKILPKDLVADVARGRRFVREAQLASSLQHPHIVTIFDIGSDPTDYLAMEHGFPPLGCGCEYQGRQARFRDPERSLDTFDFDFNKKMNRALIHEFATGRFIAQREDAPGAVGR